MKTTDTREGTIIDVFVKPNFREFSVKIDDGEIVVFCTEEPVKGKINRELVKELSKFFKRKVLIVSGLTSRQKRLLVEGARKSEVERLLLAI